MDTYLHCATNHGSPVPGWCQGTLLTGPASGTAGASLWQPGPPPPQGRLALVPAGAGRVSWPGRVEMGQPALSRRRVQPPGGQGLGGCPSKQHGAWGHTARTGSGGAAVLGERARGWKGAARVWMIRAVGSREGADQITMALSKACRCVLDTVPGEDPASAR